MGTARRLLTPFCPSSTIVSSVYGFSHSTGPTRLCGFRRLTSKWRLNTIFGWLKELQRPDKQVYMDLLFIFFQVLPWWDRYTLPFLLYKDHQLLQHMPEELHEHWKISLPAGWFLIRIFFQKTIRTQRIQNNRCNQAGMENGCKKWNSPGKYFFGTRSQLHSHITAFFKEHYQEETNFWKKNNLLDV